jgi:ABC-type polysaccharide/polyol phosphate export permease
MTGMQDQPLWTVRTPRGVQVCRRQGERFVPVRTPWVGDRLALLRLFVGNDFRARYRAQALGVVWSLLQPLVMMGILSLVFTTAFRSPEPHFPVFLLIGLLLWQWVSQALNAATLSFVVNADMVKRTVFPRALLPVSAVLSHGLNACVESLVLLLLIPFFPGALHVSAALLAIPLLLACLVVLLCAVGVAASVLNVVYRDVAYLVSTGLLILYWLTPVVYPPSLLPPRVHAILSWNPLSLVLTGVRDAAMRGRFPSAFDWARLIGETILLGLTAVAIFRRVEREMLDHV